VAAKAAKASLDGSSNRSILLHKECLVFSDLKAHNRLIAVRSEVSFGD
jgi:hypothetical protein